MKNNSDDYLDSFSDKPMHVGVAEKIFNGLRSPYLRQRDYTHKDDLELNTYTLNDHTEVVAEKKGVTIPMR